jgi:hypothetical protein
MTPVTFLTVHTEQKTQPRSRLKRVVLLVLALLILCGVAGAGYWGLHRQYVPPDAITLSERFLSLIKAGNLSEAYSLTTQDAMSGRTEEQFEANVRRRLGSVLVNEHSVAELRGVRNGFQTYGNRLRRWIAGRKIDPDGVSLEFSVPAPLEIRLVSSREGKWKISYFQVHAA